jgi:hypothetical protein
VGPKGAPEFGALNALQNAALSSVFKGPAAERAAMGDY